MGANKGIPWSAKRRKKFELWKKNGGTRKPPSFRNQHTEETKNKISISVKLAALKRPNRLVDSKGNILPSIYADDWVKVRREIYERDNYRCQECGVKVVGKTKKKGGDTIACHHIDYNKMNNHKNNLITLCFHCHAKTNYSRTDWTKYFSVRFQ